MPFGLPGLGVNSLVLMKHEATYGTAATSAAEYASEIVSAEITPRLSTIVDPSLSNTQRSSRFIGQGGQYYEWSVKVRAGYNGMLPWIRMMFPCYASTVNEATARTHTFKEIAPAGTIGMPAAGYGQVQWGWTIDILWGNVSLAGTGKPTRLIGALATGLRFTAQAGTGENAMLMCEISGVCKSVTPALPSGALTSVSLPAALGVLYHQQLRATAGQFGIGTGTAQDEIQMKSMEVNITQPFDLQRFLFGQVNAESPVPNGIMDCTFNMELEYKNETEFVSMLAGGGATIKYLFQNPVIIAGATTLKPEFEIHALVPTAAEYSTAVPGYGVITQRLSHKAAWSTTDSSAVVVRVQNVETAMPF